MQDQDAHVAKAQASRMRGRRLSLVIHGFYVSRSIAARYPLSVLCVSFQTSGAGKTD